MARKRSATAVAQEPAGYGELLEDLKTRIRGAQVRAALAVNRELIGLYWDIGRAIVERQQHQEWGSAVIERLSNDLRAAFPEAQGFSPRSLWRMRALFLAYSDPELLPHDDAASRGPASSAARSVILSQPVAEIATPEAAAARSVILSQPVAEIATLEAAADRSVILSQPVAEITTLEAAADRSVIL